MHRLFLGISGVADQLQTNHAKDLRVILKTVFTVCQSDSADDDIVQSATTGRCSEKGPCSEDTHNTLFSSSNGMLLTFITQSLWNIFSQKNNWNPTTSYEKCMDSKPLLPLLLLLLFFSTSTSLESHFLVTIDTVLHLLSPILLFFRI